MRETRLLMARCPKLQVYEGPVVCPYCHEGLLFLSVIEWLTLSQRHCPLCKRQLLIENGQVVKVPAEPI